MITAMSESRVDTRVEAALKTRHQVSSLFVPHPQFTRARAEIDYLLDLTEGEDDEMPGILVLGHTRSGKSTLLKKVVQEAGEVKRDAVVLTDLRYSSRAVADYIPIVQFKMPTEPTVKSVAREILKALGDPIWWRASDAANLKGRAEYLLETCRPRALWIDEAHHAVDRAGTYVAEELADWLKLLLDNTRVPQILSGLHRLQYLFDHNEQLRGRYNNTIELGAYVCFHETAKGIVADETELLDFLGILAAFVNETPLENRLDLNDESLARRFYCATCGLIGFVKKILRSAVEIVAIQKRPPRLDLILLEAAYQRAVLKKFKGSTAVNPFGRSYQGELPQTLATDSEFGEKRAKRRRRKKEYVRAVARALTR